MRPAVVIVFYGRVRVYIDVHDAYHRRKKRWWRARLAAVHPDTILANRLDPSRVLMSRFKGRRGTEFQKVVRGYRHWIRRERTWYEQYGIEPPRWSGTSGVDLAGAVSRTSHDERLLSTSTPV